MYTYIFFFVRYSDMQLVGHINKQENLLHVFTMAGQRFDQTKFYSARVNKKNFFFLKEASEIM